MKLFLTSLAVGTPFYKATTPGNYNSGYNEAKTAKVATGVISRSTETVLKVALAIAVISAIPPIIKYVKQKLESDNQEPESEEKRVRDNKSVIHFAMKEGKAEGIQEGEKRALEKLVKAGLVSKSEAEKILKKPK